MAPYGYFYMEIRKGIPGLKQVRRLARDHLTKNLAINRYAPVPRTPSLWCHHTSDLMFSLVVDNFGIKYISVNNTHVAEPEDTFSNPTNLSIMATNRPTSPPTTGLGFFRKPELCEHVFV